MKIKNPDNVRDVALSALLTIEKQHAYSQILLNDVIKESQLKEKDIALLTQLVYGVVQRFNTLDYYLSSFIQGKKKPEDWVVMLLRLSLYQMVYLDKIPDHAILNEAVNLAKRRGHKGIAGYVNAVLRNIQRTGLPDLEALSDPIERISLMHSHPRWMVAHWIEAFGEQTTEAICKANNIPPQVTARTNELKITRSDLINILKEEGLDVREGVLSDQAIVVINGVLPRTNAFKEGLCTIQDESSMLVARALDPKPGMRVLDACAGPGGKATHLAEKLDQQGELIALDLHPHKTKLIDTLAVRLGISTIHTKSLDARRAREVYESASFDRILIDAPCTGLGVIRHKPDIKWSKKLSDVHDISRVQYDILESVAPLLKAGGKLVYSTCTIEKEENQAIIDRFIQNHPEYQLDLTVKDRLPEKVVQSCLSDQGTVQILPHQFESDGFYIACISRV